MLRNLIFGKLREWLVTSRYLKAGRRRRAVRDAMRALHVARVHVAVRVGRTKLLTASN